MATPNIVPKADQEGGLGTAAKSWGKLFIENAAAGGTAAATISNLDIDQIALDINAANTTANVLELGAESVTTSDAMKVTCNSLTSGSAISLDVNDSQVGSIGTQVKSLIEIDFDKSAAVTGGADITYGLNVNMKDSATNGASANVYMYGAQIDIESTSAQGIIIQKGLVLNVAKNGVADTATPLGYYTCGLETTVIDGQPDIKMVSSADVGDFCTIGTAANGATSIITSDDDGANAHLTLTADGNIVQNSVDWDVNATGAATLDATSMDMNVGSGTLELTTTGALDINSGAATVDVSSIDVNSGSGTIELTTTGALDVNSGATTVDTAALTVTHSALAKFMTTGGVEIENNASSGAAALTIDNNDVDKIALDIDAANTTANIIDIDATALTTGKAIHIDAADGGQALIHIDKDHTSSASVNASNGLINVDYLKSGATGDEGNVTASSINIVHKDTATNHAGSTVALTAIKAEVDFANSTGTTSATGLELIVTDAATNRGIVCTTEDGGVDFRLNSSADTGDNFSIITTTHGATTLKTTDDDAAAAHIVFEADGNVDVNGLTITLDAATKIELEQNTDVTGDLGVSAEATVNSLICTTGAGFGGGYGSTGATISTAGVGQFNGALTTDAALTTDNIVCTNAATFGGGTGSTGVTISTAGAVTADGLISSTASGVTGINYRTIWIDAGSMVPQVTNGAAAGTSESADAYDVMNDYFAFDASTIEFTQYKLAMPLQWNGGTIKAKFYWKPASSTTTSHSVMWGIDGQAHADGGELGAWGTTVSVTADDVIATDSPKKVHLSAASGAVTIAGSPAAGASELVYLRFQRVADHATDDLNEDAHLLGVAIQYQETAALQSAW